MTVPRLEPVVKDEVARFVQIVVSFPDKDLLTEVAELIKILHADELGLFCYHFTLYSQLTVSADHLRDKVTDEVKVLHKGKKNEMGLLQALPNLCKAFDSPSYSLKLTTNL